MFGKQTIYRDYGELVLVHQKAERVFYLFEATGADIARGLHCGYAPHEIAENIRAAYDVPAHVDVLDDVLAFVHALRRDGALVSGNGHPLSPRDDSGVSAHFGADETDLVVATEDDVCDYCAAHLIPYTATWELTFDCNLRCVHCYCPDPTKDTFWTIERVECAMRELKSLGTVDIEFTGGECFTHPQIDTILQLADSKGFVFAILTNGIALTADRVESIAEYHPRCVQLSIYSLDEHVHDAITRRANSLRRTLDALHMLRHNGVRVEIACTLMKENASDAFCLADWAEEHALPLQFGFKLTNSSNPMRHPEEHRVDSDVLRKLLRDPRINPVPRAMKKGRQPKPPHDRSLCHAGLRNLALSAAGDVFPCNSLRLRVGHMAEHSLCDIWPQSPILADWRHISIDTYDKCRVCAARGICEPCPASFYAETGRLDAIHPDDCRIGRLFWESMNPGSPTRLGCSE